MLKKKYHRLFCIYVFQRDRALRRLKIGVKNIKKKKKSSTGVGSELSGRREHWYINTTDNVNSLSLMAK